MVIEGRSKPCHNISTTYSNNLTSLRIISSTRPMMGFSFYDSKSDDESVVDVDVDDMDIDWVESSEIELESEPSNIPDMSLETNMSLETEHEEKGDAQLAPTSNDEHDAVTQDDLTAEEEEHIDIINPRPGPVREVPTEPPESEVKGGLEPSTPTPTKEPRDDFKGVPIPTEEPRTDFKGVLMSTEPPGTNPEGPTGPNINGVPWVNSEINEAAIPGSKAKRNEKQRERHRKYTRTRHDLTSSRERCVEICLPTRYKDRARSHRVRRDGKSRQQSCTGGATDHRRWILHTRQPQ